jgi:hypothetical protein
MAPQILVIVRESPVAERTEALMRTLVSQEPREALKIAVLTLRQTRMPSRSAGQAGIDEISVQDDWPEQVCRLAGESGCRWMVLPSVSDRYFPGAFQRLTEIVVEKGQSAVAPSYVRLDGERFLAGPSPFHFDYFSLLTGFSYIAPGATFIDVATFLAAGGFDRRFPNAAVLEYLLRAGPTHGVTALMDPVLETEGDPFPGVPRDYAPLYALEVAALTLHAHRFIFTPGAALGLVTTLADHLRRHPGLHSNSLTGLLIPQLDGLKREYLANLGICQPIAEAEVGKTEKEDELLEPASASVTVQVPAEVLSNWRKLRSRVKAVMPTPIWNSLRRVKRIWKALVEPLPDLAG